MLPQFLSEVHIQNLTVGAASVDLLLERHAHDVGISVLRRTGSLEIVSVR